MQAARYESGLDDSPMYDGHFFAVTDNKTGYGLMQMYDVGRASLEAEYLPISPSTPPYLEASQRRMASVVAMS